MGQANTNLKCIDNHAKTPANVYYDPPKAVFVLIDPKVKLTDTIKLSLRSSLRFVAARWKLIKGGIFIVFHATANDREGGRRLECVYDSRDGSSCFGSGLDFEEMYRSAERGMQGVESIPLYDACMDLINLTSEKEFEKYRRVVDIFTNGIDGDGTKKMSKCSVEDLLREFNCVPKPKLFHAHIYTATPKTPGELFYGLREAAFMDNFLMQFHSMDEDTVPKPELLKTLRPSNKYQQGLALLINNRFINSKQCEPRTGAEKDTEIVRAKFRELTGHDVMVHEDVATETELQEALDKFILSVEKQRPSYIVVIVSSHGQYPHRIVLNSGEIVVDYYECLVHQLKPKEKDDPLDIPQIFIIQACQKIPENSSKAEGEKHLSRTKKTTKNAHIKEIVEIPKLESDSLREDGQEVLQQDGQEVSIGNGCRRQYCIYLCQATLPHSVAYRSAQGSLFLQVICRLFHKGPKLDDLMALVDEEMTRNLEACRNRRKKGEQQISVGKVWDRAGFPPEFCFSVKDTENAQSFVRKS